MGNRTLNVGALAVCLAILCPHPSAWADLPQVDLTTLSVYRQALLSSTDERAKDILREIADGPADLATAKTAAIQLGIQLKPDVTPPPEDQNAAALYKEWFAQAVKGMPSPPPYAAPLTLKYLYTPDQIGKVQSQQNQDANALLMSAVSKPFLYVKPSTIGEPGGFPNYGEPRAAARQLTTLSTLLALQGHWDNAAAMQANGFAVVHQCAQSKTVISYLVAAAVDALTTTGMQSLLTHAQPDNGLCELCTKSVTDSADFLDLKTALEGEAPTTLQEYDQITSTIVIGPKTEVDKNIFTAEDKDFFCDLIYAAEARYLNRLRLAVIAAAEAPIPRSIDLAAIPQKSVTSEATDPIDAADFGIDSYGKLAIKADTVAARRQVLLAGAAVLGFKAKTGSFPPALPGVFIDPFGGRQLVYKLSGEGFVVYSVGPTGDYTGPPVQGTEGTESAFIYPAAPPVPVPANMLGQ